MVDEPRREEPLYRCVVLVEAWTRRSQEEVMAFGSSPEAAQQEAKTLLVRDYGCSLEQAEGLLEQASIEAVNPWCSR